MIIKSLDYNQRETVDGVFTNYEGATITTGYVVAVSGAASSLTAASIDGNAAATPKVFNNRLFYGPSLQDTPNNSIGLARLYGMANSVFVFAHGTSVTVGAGEPAGPGVVNSYGVSSAGLKDGFGPLVLIDTAGAAVCSPGGYVRGFVRGM